MEYGMCTEMTVLPDAYPTSGRTYEMQQEARAETAESAG